MKPGKYLVLLGSAVIVACGGGGSGTMAGIDGGGAFPPVATSIVSQGAITGFGSIVVNGVRYDTSSTDFTIDGEPGSESDLAVGHVVLVRGTIDDDGLTGTAESVVYDELVEGPVEAIDLASATLVVLGQTVITNGDTSYEDEISPRSLDGLAVDDIVEVSGYRNAGGDVVATRIELEDGVGDFETTGIVQNLDAGAMTFQIGSLVVDYGQAMLEDFPSGGPENGLLVEAEGRGLGESGELIATVVEFRGNDIDIDDADEVEVEGLITRFVSISDFDVNGVPVTTNGSTEYENGTSSDLAVDVKVEVEGTLNASGTLVAEEVDFRPEGSIRLGGLVQDVQSARVTMLGIDISVDQSTELEDESELDLPAFNLGDVAVGDYLEVRAYADGSALIATRLERDDDPGSVFVRGLVEAVAEPEFVIAGVTVTTSAATEFGSDGGDLTATGFFSQAEGRVVQADGMFQGGILQAEKVEFED